MGSSTLEQFVYHPVREARPPLLSRRGVFSWGAHYPRSEERGNLEECAIYKSVAIYKRGNLEEACSLKECAIDGKKGL